MHFLLLGLAAVALAACTADAVSPVELVPSDPTTLTTVLNGLLSEVGTGAYADVLGINQAIKRIAEDRSEYLSEVLVPNGDDGYDLDLDLSDFEDLPLGLTGLRLKGLDEAISRMDLSDRTDAETGEYTFSAIEFAPLDLELDLFLDGDLLPIDAPLSATVGLTVEGLVLDLGLLLELNSHRLGMVPVAALPTALLPCLLSTLDTVRVELGLEAASIPTPKIDSGSPLIDGIVNAALGAAWEDLEPQLIAALPGIAANLTVTLNEALEGPFECAADTDAPPGDDAPPPPGDLVDLTEARLFTFVGYLISDLVGAKGDLGVNRIIHIGSVFQSGVPGEFALENDEEHGAWFNANIDFGAELGKGNIKIKDVLLTGLENAMTALTVLEAKEGPYDLHNDIGITAASPSSAEQQLLVEGEGSTRRLLQEFVPEAPAVGATIDIWADKLFKGGELFDSVRLSLGLEGALQIGLDLATKVLDPSNPASPLRHFVLKDLTRLPCLLSALDDAELTEVRAQFTPSEFSPHPLVLGADCVDRSSPGWEEIDALWKEAAAMDQVDQLLAAGTAELEKLLLGEDAAQRLRDAIAGAGESCAAAIEADVPPPEEGGEEEEEEEEDDTWYLNLNFEPEATQLATLLIGTLVVLPVVSTIFVCSFLMWRGSQRRKMKQPPASESLLGTLVKGSPFGEEDEDAIFAEASIWSSTAVPLYAKCLVFLGVVGAICFFATASSMVGASVNLVLFFMGRETNEIEVAGFSLKGSIQDMWDAEVYPLALMIAIWSGAWPYTKQVLLIFAMVAPPDVLSLPSRGKLIRILDGLSKWCLIDIYLLMMMMVAFKFYLPIDDQSFANASAVIPADFVVVDVTVLPEWGFFGFVIASILSLVCSHVAIIFHLNAEAFDKMRRKDRHALGSADGLTLDEVMESAMKSPNGTTLVIKKSEGGPEQQVAEVSKAASRTSRARSFAHTIPAEIDSAKEALCWHSFSPFSEEGAAAHQDERVAFGYGKIVMIGLTLVITMALVFLGGYLTSFTFIFEGLAGTALELLVPGGERRSYSLIELCVELGEQIGEDSSATEVLQFGFMQGTYLLFAYVVPLGQIAVLFALWITPLTLNMLKVLHIVSDFAAAWGALEVFIVVIIAAVLQISQFARYIIGAAIPGNEDGTYFDVQTELNEGTWVLFAAAFMLVTTNWYISRLAQRAIKDRESDFLSMEVRFVSTGGQSS